MPKTLTPGDGQDLFARYKHAWERRDPEAMLELYAEDAEYRIDPFMKPLMGANAIREHWNSIIGEQAHIEFDVENVWVSGRTVLGNWHVALSRRATAERARARGFTTMELDEAGLIERMHEWSVTKVVGIDSSLRSSGATDQAGE